MDDIEANSCVTDMSCSVMGSLAGHLDYMWDGPVSCSVVVWGVWASEPYPIDVCEGCGPCDYVTLSMSDEAWSSSDDSCCTEVTSGLGSKVLILGETVSGYAISPWCVAHVWCVSCVGEAPCVEDSAASCLNYGADVCVREVVTGCGACCDILVPGVSDSEDLVRLCRCLRCRLYCSLIVSLCCRDRLMWTLFVLVRFVRLVFGRF